MASNRVLSRVIVNNRGYFDLKWSIIELSFFTDNSDDFKRGMHAAFNALQQMAAPDAPLPDMRDPDLDPQPEDNQ